jgi:hypothetical protein
MGQSQTNKSNQATEQISPSSIRGFNKAGSNQNLHQNLNQGVAGKKEIPYGRGEKNSPLCKPTTVPYAFPSPPPTINEHLLSEFFTEMRQGMVSVLDTVKVLREDIQVLKFQNASRSSFVTQLADPSTLRIGSNSNISEPGSATSGGDVHHDRSAMNQTSNPGPSSLNETIELGCSNVDTLLAAGSDEETDATQEEDLSAFLPESEEEKDLPAEKPFSWVDNE